jgi:hypothetical protein
VLNKLKNAYLPYLFLIPTGSFFMNKTLSFTIEIVRSCHNLMKLLQDYIIDSEVATI